MQLIGQYIKCIWFHISFQTKEYKYYDLTFQCADAPYLQEVLEEDD